MKLEPLCLVDPQLKRRIKSYAALLDKTVQQIVHEALTDAVDNTLPAQLQGESERIAAKMGAA